MEKGQCVVRMLWCLCFIATVPWSSGFTITAKKDVYVTDAGRDVVLECLFPHRRPVDLRKLIVYWEKDNSRIVQLVNGTEEYDDEAIEEHPGVELLMTPIFAGTVSLRIPNVAPEDAGVYCCMVSYGGTDYKRMTLVVESPYLNINYSVIFIPSTREYDLTCQSIGFPAAEVIWRNEQQEIINNSVVTSTSVLETNSRLLNVTSHIRVPGNSSHSFSCTFMRSSYQEDRTVIIDIPRRKSAWELYGLVTLIILVIILLLCMAFLGVLFYSVKWPEDEKEVDVYSVSHYPDLQCVAV